MLQRWSAPGPELNRVIEQFADVADSHDEEFPHHEEGTASQHRFKRYTTDLFEVLFSHGNSFEENSVDLVTLKCVYLFISKDAAQGKNKIGEKKTASCCSIIVKEPAKEG